MLMLLIVAGCRASAVGNGAGGADSAQMAVVEFLAAARAQDLQAISAVWGNDESPTRDRVERQELERRLLIIACHLRHEESRLEPPQSGEGGRTLFTARIQHGNLSAEVPFTTVRNRHNGRWYVEDLDLRPAREICNSEQMTRPAVRTPPR
jgi:hypothetical protein